MKRFFNQIIEDYWSFILVKIIHKAISVEKDLLGKHLKHSVITKWYWMCNVIFIKYNMYSTLLK